MIAHYKIFFVSQQFVVFCMFYCTFTVLPNFITYASIHHFLNSVISYFNISLFHGFLPPLLL